MSGIKIANGTAASAEQTVDTNGNAHVTLPTTVSQGGFATLAAEVDAGTVSGTRYLKELEASEDYRLRVGIDSMLFNHSFEGTNIARDRIQQNDTTMTAAQASGFLTLNSGGNTTTNNGTNVRTYRTFPIFGTYTTYVEMWCRETNETAANAISEWGVGYVSGVTATPTDGVFFRRLSGGQLRAVINFGGAETANDIDSPSAGDVHHYLIAIHTDEVEFWIDNVLYKSVQVPTNQPMPTSAMSQPVFARVWNSGTAGAARSLGLGFINVSLGDMDSGKPWGHMMCGLGGGAYQVQPGTASAQTANYANSAAPASASLSNTAAGYTTLGGQWQFAASATNETDWALFGYQNPAGTATLPGKTLYVTSIRVGETVVTGAAGVNATMFFWGAATGSTAVSLATTDAAATVAPRRVALGAQSFLASAPVGTMSPGFTVDFEDAPLVCPPGLFFHVFVKQLNGAATASLVWRGTVTIIGYFE